MRNNIVVAVLVLLFGSLSGVRAEEAAEIGFHTYEAQVVAEVEDTSYVLHPMLFAKPTLSGAEIRVQSITGASEAEVPALVTRALRGAKNRVPVTLTQEEGVIRTLKAHRRLAGAGVHGPFQVRGKLFLVIVPKGDRFVVSGSLTPAALEGPKGSWKR